MPNQTIEMKPIGTVRTAVPDDAVAGSRRQIISRIVIDEPYAEALLGIDAYSHLFVLFWLDRQTSSGAHVYHPRGNSELPLTGVLASRGRNHPNPIGLAVVELIEYRNPELIVRCLDAFDGTPVLDIKPYDHYDRVLEPRVPPWFLKRAMTAGE